MKLRMHIQKLIVLLLLVVLIISACSKQAVKENNANNANNGSQALVSKSIEELTKDYFANNKGEVDNSAKIISVTNEFFAISNTNEFAGKKPCKIQPIYAYGIDGVAYYEVWLTEDNVSPKGWLMISATDKDYPLVNFSMGIPYSYHLIYKGNKKSLSIDNNKVYRFGVSYFTLEGTNGNKIDEYGKMPGIITTNGENSEGAKADSKDVGSELKSGKVLAKEGLDYVVIDNYESLKSEFAKYYYNSKRSAFAAEMRQRVFPLNGHGEVFSTLKGAYNYRWISGTQCLYGQIPAHTSSNNTDCWSGCTNNAWTNIFGWWDLNMSKVNLIPTTSTGEGCPTLRNTTARMNSVDPVQMYIRSLVGTYCSGGSGATPLSNQWLAYKYPSVKGYGWSYWYQWNSSAGGNVNLANIVTDCIANNYKPVHIGSNSHAWVGYGWAQWSDNTDWTWAYCYPGWQENHNDDVWISWHDFNASTEVFVN